MDYDDPADLVQSLRGMHTVLSFINQPMEGPGSNAQQNLIDACISAGVKRFAPSEYGRSVPSSTLHAEWRPHTIHHSVEKDDMPVWHSKIAVKEYLERVNQNGKVRILETSYNTTQRGDM